MIGGVKPKNLFGATMITGNFGAGKTFGTIAEIYKQALHNPDYIVIANLPYQITGIYFNSWNDLQKLIDHLYHYFAITNKDIHNLGQFKNIIMVIDEIHLYFPARQSMDKGRALLWNKLNTVITQCRKRNIKFWFITQRAQKTDIEFRRLADFIWYYKFNRFFGLPINKVCIIKSGGGLSDLIGEDGTTWENEEQLEKDIVYRGIGEHNTFIFRKQMKLLHHDRALWNEKDLTNHICGIKDVDENGEFTADTGEDFYHLTFDEFYNKLLKTPSRVESILKITNHDNIPILSYGKKYLDFKKKVYKTEYV